jgi:dihydrolipoamide dehydrogenase
MLDHIAGENDADLVGVLKKTYEKRGVTFLLSAKVTEVKGNAVCYEKDGKPNEIVCDKVLLSIGRRANTKDAGLESIHVLTERGAVVTDAHMKTNQPEVYAAGDVNGKSMLAHTAYREAEVAVNTMLGKHDTMRYEAVPGVIYTNPELAAVGETEKSASAKGLDVACVKLTMRYSGRYVAENEGGNGIMKLIVSKETKKVLGAQVLANYASEFIVTVGTFIELGLTVDEVKEIVFPHPTVCEIVREAVFQF